jgi:hypothetical protein
VEGGGRLQGCAYAGVLFLFVVQWGFDCACSRYAWILTQWCAEGDVRERGKGCSAGLMFGDVVQGLQACSRYVCTHVCGVCVLQGCRSGLLCSGALTAPAAGMWVGGVQGAVLHKSTLQLPPSIGCHSCIALPQLNSRHDLLAMLPLEWL